MQAIAADDVRPVSFLTPVGYQAGSCGYCADPLSSASYYAVAKTLDVDHYQALVDRGWRRSGTLLYKPDTLRSCRPHYTIRLPVADFKPSKDQRRAVNRWNTHVLGEPYIKEAARLHPKSREQKARQRNEFSLLDAVHESEYERMPKPPDPEHCFEVTLEPDNYTEEKYRLFEHYQMNVHHDSASAPGFVRFLCKSPLKRRSRTVNGVEQKLGSYHQCYRLDGRLIAIGVLDLLPHCVSGVYFIYHQDFEKWSFGKLSALREAALAIEGAYQYYYMGYYIHSCIKMRYKADYKPQYVMDPETNEWTLFDEEMKRLLDGKAYVSMSREKRLKDSERPEDPHDLVMSDGDDKSLRAPTAAYNAVQDGLSLFRLGVPGVMTAESLQEQMDLNEVKIALDGSRYGFDGDLVVTCDLVSWDNNTIYNPHALKGTVAELAACTGPQVAREMIVTLSS